MSVEVRAAAPVTTAAVSPLTYPVMVSVKVGSGAAKARVASTALDGEGGGGDGDLGRWRSVRRSPVVSVGVKVAVTVTGVALTGRTPAGL